MHGCVSLQDDKKKRKKKDVDSETEEVPKGKSVST